MCPYIVLAMWSAGILNYNSEFLDSFRTNYFNDAFQAYDKYVMHSNISKCNLQFNIHRLP